MDIGKLSRGERIIGGAGVLLFADSFLPWFRYCLAIGNVGVLSIHQPCASRGAWTNTLSVLALLVAIAMVAQIGVHHFSTARMSAPGTMSWGQAHLFAGFAVLALVVLQSLAGYHPYGISWHRAFGIYVGLVCAAGLAYGGMVRSREPEPTPEG
jgi:hypothetical protein